jgi:hypothetical protein
MGKKKNISLNPLGFTEAVSDVVRVKPEPKEMTEASKRARDFAKGPRNNSCLGHKGGKKKAQLPEGSPGPSLTKRPPASLKRP